MTQVPINPYYIEIQGYDWLIIFNRVLKRHQPKDETDLSVVAYADGRTVFTIRRDFIPADEIAKAIGSTPEAVDKAQRIMLTKQFPFTVAKQPTVNYYGLA